MNYDTRDFMVNKIIDSNTKCCINCIWYKIMKKYPQYARCSNELSIYFGNDIGNIYEVAETVLKHKKHANNGIHHKCKLYYGDV